MENAAALGCVSMSSCSQQQTRVMSVFWSYSEREEHAHISEVSDCSCVLCELRLVLNESSLSVLSLRCSRTLQTRAAKNGTATMGLCGRTPTFPLLSTRTPSAPHTPQPPPTLCCPTLPAAHSPPPTIPTPSCLLAHLLPLSSSMATVFPTPKEAL